MVPSMIRDMEASGGDDCASEMVLMADVLFCDAAIYSYVVIVFGQAPHGLTEVGNLATLQHGIISYTEPSRLHNNTMERWQTPLDENVLGTGRHHTEGPLPMDSRTTRDELVLGDLTRVGGDLHEQIWRFRRFGRKFMLFILKTALYGLCPYGDHDIKTSRFGVFLAI